jgi:hypothetical protein
MKHCNSAKFTQIEIGLPTMAVSLGFCVATLERARLIKVGQLHGQWQGKQTLMSPLDRNSTSL